MADEEEESVDEEELPEDLQPMWTSAAGSILVAPLFFSKSMNLLFVCALVQLCMSMLVSIT